MSFLRSLARARRSAVRLASARRMGTWSAHHSVRWASPSRSATTTVVWRPDSTRHFSSSSNGKSDEGGNSDRDAKASDELFPEGDIALEFGNEALQSKSGGATRSSSSGDADFAGPIRPETLMMVESRTRPLMPGSTLHIRIDNITQLEALFGLINRGMPWVGVFFKRYKFGPKMPSAGGSGVAGEAEVDVSLAAAFGEPHFPEATKLESSAAEPADAETVAQAKEQAEELQKSSSELLEQVRQSVGEDEGESKSSPSTTSTSSKADEAQSKTIAQRLYSELRGGAAGLDPEKDLHHVGCLAQIQKIVPAAGGMGADLIVGGIHRIQLQKVLKTTPLMVGEVSHIDDYDLMKAAMSEGMAFPSASSAPESASTTRKQRKPSKSQFANALFERLVEDVPSSEDGSTATVETKTDTSKMSPEELKELNERVFSLDDGQDMSQLVRLSAEVLNVVRSLMRENRMFYEHMTSMVNGWRFFHPVQVAEGAIGLTGSSGADLQNVLSTFNVARRMEKCIYLLKRDLEALDVQRGLQVAAEEKMKANSRKFVLMEQMKAIKKELGLDKDDKESIIAKFQERLADKVVPEQVQDTINDEINKLMLLEPANAEFNATRNYLDWLTALPWGVYTEDFFDTFHARSVLNEDHYGLADVKKRIVEFIAVGALKGSHKVASGKIVCLVGPPGVGKTSIGKSIARAMQRKFARIAVGGIHDVSEIKGHRRTYVGSMPGSVVQALKRVECSNPVIMVDEVDKLVRGGHHGDPASALLEVFDPSQNDKFQDLYMDMPIDLTNVFFVCTANVEENIPGPLRDRMEFIRIPGYLEKEKIEIASRHLIPTIREDTSISEEQVSFSDGALADLVRWYCREAGVRNLQQHLEKVFRKCALQLVEGSMKQVRIDSDNLTKFVGQRKFTTDRMWEDRLPVGVSMGMAYTSMGGTSIYIESRTCDGLPYPHVSGQPDGAEDSESDGEEQKARDLAHQGPSQGSFSITGQMGEVMKESTSIAYTVAKSKISGVDPYNDFFRCRSIHMHVPEGAVPKDGPSAGITMVTALCSLALNEPVKSGVAMTGELSLMGRVLPIGGVREKLIAARRNRIREIIIPRDNHKDFVEVPAHVKRGLTVHFAENYDQVFGIMFPDFADEDALDSLLTVDVSSDLGAIDDPDRDYMGLDMNSGVTLEVDVEQSDDDDVIVHR